MTNEQEKIINKELQSVINKASMRGMTMGMRTTSKIIYDKIVKVNDKSSAEELLEVIKDIKRYCETDLKDNK